MKWLSKILNKSKKSSHFQIDSIQPLREELEYEIQQCCSLNNPHFENYKFDFEKMIPQFQADILMHANEYSKLSTELMAAYLQNVFIKKFTIQKWKINRRIKQLNRKLKKHSLSRP